MVVSLLCLLTAHYQLACAKPGGSAWTLLPPFPFEEEATVFIFYEGQLFGISLMGELLVLDLHLERKWEVISSELFPTIERVFRSCF